MTGAAGGWRKLQSNPVGGGELGTCFDVSVLQEDGRFRMWFSWRPRKSLALVESLDGIHWGEPQIVLGPNPQTVWEEDVNRPAVLQRADGHHLWYTGQTPSRSYLGYATSPDGAAWTRQSAEPVLSAEPGWEKNTAVMCPHVLWEERLKLFRMWYSGGEQYEPNALGYATSADGLHWTKCSENPVFQPDAGSPWERHKVPACQIVQHNGWHVMFYIGFRDEHCAQIGVARSRDGVTGWERHPQNPILFPTGEGWDVEACYKPFALLEGDRWLLWYNGRRGNVEQIGLAIHSGRELWPASAETSSPMAPCPLASTISQARRVSMSTSA
ncbi:MAG: hypothetical protein GW911_14255 [Armatimonadetes bacterium]|nr:hypothetical protein [Armatimonadota bacterium]NCO90786.1 hypothetical protein [Armatimonadota bacterium]NCP33948.1 hypothetical protein [Armatimonadota bacterium]NDK13186.1 hypothetical protein [Armatimonadota bacterium]